MLKQHISRAMAHLQCRRRGVLEVRDVIRTKRVAQAIPRPLVDPGELFECRKTFPEGVTLRREEAIFLSSMLQPAGKGGVNLDVALLSRLRDFCRDINYGILQRNLFPLQQFQFRRSQPGKKAYREVSEQTETGVIEGSP